MKPRRIVGSSVALTVVAAICLLPVRTAGAQPPSTSVVVPADDATVSGTTQALDAVTSSGATGVQYEVTGGTLTDSPIATGTATIYGWLALWNTTTVPNGTYALESVASFPGGVSATSSAVTITVDNAPPSTAVVVPANNTTVSGASQALDAVTSPGVTQVHFELTGGTLTDSVIATGTATIYGWLAQWNTTGVVNGSYALQSVASYSGGVTMTSAPITVIVDNPPPSTTVVVPSGVGSGDSVDLTQNTVFDAVASPGVTAVSFEVEIDLSPPDVLTFAAIPTIYGWVALVPGTGGCSPDAPRCFVTSLPGAVASVASYANGESAPSPPVNVTVTFNTLDP